MGLPWGAFCQITLTSCYCHVDVVSGNIRCLSPWCCVGYIGIVKDATSTTARVELHTNCKTISVDISRLSTISLVHRWSSYCCSHYFLWIDSKFAAEWVVYIKCSVVIVSGYICSECKKPNWWKIVCCCDSLKCLAVFKIHPVSHIPDIDHRLVIGCVVEAEWAELHHAMIVLRWLVWRHHMAVVRRCMVLRLRCMMGLVHRTTDQPRRLMMDRQHQAAPVHGILLILTHHLGEYLLTISRLN